MSRFLLFIKVYFSVILYGPPLFLVQSSGLKTSSYRNRLKSIYLSSTTKAKNDYQAEGFCDVA